MDKSLRNSLYTVVVKCRSLLESDLALQLEGRYGIHMDGVIEPLHGLTRLDAVGRADRQAIEAAIHHRETAGTGRQDAIQRYVRESSFTLLNRLAALKLMEHPSRALIQPSVGAGEQSKGFRQLSMLSPEALRGEPDGGYRLYLELLSDDLAHLIGVIFDRSAPTSIIFPSSNCLRDVLGQLNDASIEPAWAEDETVGWIYQYFTPTEQREQARKASGAPRSSYELAFRNQFYTPSYVVGFLTDNTLGRLWWEMRRGDTRLAELCRYLVKRTNGSLDMAAQPKKDPRKLRVLDPAGGSGHFLLYAFDLLQIIYDEAYDDPELGPALHTDYPDKPQFRQAVPGLILAHNLHAIDIDLRACHIASLALWLRAQRALAEMGLKVRQRPAIKRANVVCAEPMPGEYDLLGEFSRDLQPAILGKMLLDIWEHMRLAGEAGSLLKIEQEIAGAVRRAKKTLAEMPPGIQLTLFGPQEPQGLLFNPAELRDEEFWAQADARVLEKLRQFAQQAVSGPGVLRRLFADDAMQGMALIDMLRQPFDIVLMNPPFGAASLGSKAYIERAYPRTKNDLYAAFVERGLDLLRPGGYLGAITSRTGFFLTSFQAWREEILLTEAQLITLADLGYGVLDTAMVETAAYVLRKGPSGA